MNDKSEVLKLIQKLDEEKEKKFIIQILIMIKTHLSADIKSALLFFQVVNHFICDIHQYFF